MKIKLLFLAILLINHLSSFSQLEDNAKAKLYFQEAQTRFNQNDFEEALTYISKTEETLGSTNGRILNLKVKTLYNDGQFLKAEKALNIFIEFYTESVTQELKDETLAYFVKIEKASDASREEQAKKDAFAQTIVKIGNLEVMKNSNSGRILGEWSWEGAKKACADLGDGWRLPTKDELNVLYQNKDKIGGFGTGGYWNSDSMSFDKEYPWLQDFGHGGMARYLSQDGGYVRAVRTF